MNDQVTPPKPADLRPIKGEGATLEAAEKEAALMAKMSQPIDVKANYVISGADVQGMYTLIDEVPMKYARQLLPALAGSLEKLED